MFFKNIYFKKKTDIYAVFNIYYYFTGLNSYCYFFAIRVNFFINMYIILYIDYIIICNN